MNNPNGVVDIAVSTAVANEALAEVVAAPEPLTPLNAIRRRYPSPEWVLMEEVAPSTGGGTRYADAIAVNTWHSRGYAVLGFEVKVHRSDWLRELKQPAKAEPMMRFCDRWYLVAPKGVVMPGELPTNWGLLELRANGLHVITEAPKLEAVPVTRAFFASLMRRGHEQVGQIAERMQRETVANAKADIQKRIEQRVADSTRRHKELEEAVKKFTEETGLELSPWRGPPVATIKLAKLLEPLSRYGNAGALALLTDLAGQLDRATKIIRDAIDSTGLEEQASQAQRSA